MSQKTYSESEPLSPPLHQPVRGAPPYLEGFEELYAASPRRAALEWFRSARLGLLLHYGLYSLPGGEWAGRRFSNGLRERHAFAEWIQFNACSPIPEYEELKNSFTARGFDPDRVADLALEAGMRYVVITTRHHDAFCLFETAETDFHSVNSAAGRDLVRELAEACEKRELGLFLYYSHGCDWRHPHAPGLDWSPLSRPHYTDMQLGYAPDAERDLEEYIRFVDRQITELLTQYGPVAGIWLDGHDPLRIHAESLPGGLPQVGELLKLEGLYDLIHKLQPQCLVCYKGGVTGGEDFRTFPENSDGLHSDEKPLEIHTTIQEQSWGYSRTAKYRPVEKFLELIRASRKIPANVCLNVGPKGDGSIPAEAQRILLELGQRLES